MTEEVEQDKPEVVKCPDAQGKPDVINTCYNKHMCFAGPGPSSCLRSPQVPQKNLRFLKDGKPSGMPRAWCTPSPDGNCFLMLYLLSQCAKKYRNLLRLRVQEKWRPFAPGLSGHSFFVCA